MRCRNVQLLAVAALSAAAGIACAATADAAAEADDSSRGALKGTAVVENSSSQENRLRAGVALGYSIPLSGFGHSGDTLDVYGSWAQAGSWSGQGPGLYDSMGLGSGQGAAAGIRWNQLLSSSGGHQARVSLGADVRGYKATGPLQEIEPGNDVTVTPLTLNYSGNWLMNEGAVSGSVTLLHNVGGARGSQDDIARLRPGASANFSIVRLAAELTRQLPSDFEVRAGVQGQYTNDVLLPGEQFGGSGARGGLLVRGFSDRALARDSGLAAHVELYTPEFCSASLGYKCRALVFYDKGYFRTNREIPGEIRTNTVRSVGVGLRVGISSNVDLQLDYGRVVRADMLPQQDKNRLHVRIGMRW